MRTFVYANNHAHNHADGHAHHRADFARTGNRKRLRIVLILTAFYTLAEAVGGWVTGSLALFADAGHMLTDVAALVLALVALWFTARPATARKTYGYHRLEILAALTNGVALIVISLWIFYEAATRLIAPPAVSTRVMIAVATGGLVVNLISAWLLHGAQHSHDGGAHDLNMRGAWLHIIGDVFGSLGTIIAGVLMLLFDWKIADPVIGIVIGVLIIWSSWRLIRDSTNILLEGTPAHINLAAVENSILETEGVAGVHDLHVWTITSGREALSAHVIHAHNGRARDVVTSFAR
ncbi:MAG: cation diffusion facilitator family transporter [Pyrinomonadaceae bacterium]